MLILMWSNGIWPNDKFLLFKIEELQLRYKDEVKHDVMICLSSMLQKQNKMNCELMLTYDTPAYMFNVYKKPTKSANRK